jgi:hypothetical protein
VQQVKVQHNAGTSNKGFGFITYAELVRWYLSVYLHVCTAHIAVLAPMVAPCKWDRQPQADQQQAYLCDASMAAPTTAAIFSNHPLAGH